MPKIVRFCLLLNSAHISGTVRVHAAVRFNRYRTRESVSLPWSGSPYFAALDWPSVRHWMRAVNLSRHHWFKTMQVTSTNVTLRVRPAWDLGWWHCRINRIRYKIGKIATLMLFLGPLGSDEEWKLISNFWERLRKGYYMPNDVFIFKYLSRSLSLSLYSILVRAYYILVCPWVT